MIARSTLALSLLFSATALGRFGGVGRPGAPEPVQTAAPIAKPDGKSPAQHEPATVPAFVPDPSAAPPIEDVPAPQPAESRIVAVTVYRGIALVTREVRLPEGKGTHEVVVTPLPARVVHGSLYSEGGDGLRILTTRGRVRAVREDTRKDVRALEAEIRTLQTEGRKLQAALQAGKSDLEFLQKLEGFTAQRPAARPSDDVDAPGAVGLAKYVMETRGAEVTKQADLETRIAANTEAVGFAQQRLAERTSGITRTETDAVIVVDKPNAPASTIRLSYLVSASDWRPQYRIRAGGEKEPIRIETLAAVEQQSGEDWSDVAVTLSTAQPSLSAAPAELLPLKVATYGIDGEESPEDRTPATAMVEARAGQVRAQARVEFLGHDAQAGGALLNQAAALDQTAELLSKDAPESAPGASSSGDGPNVTYHLRGTLTLPSRRDSQLLEVGRFEVAAEFFAKATPVLSPRVYRLARVINTGESVILPGDASVYVGTDFVGRMALHQVAAGEPFILGLGVDPQIQIGRRLVTKTRTVQGGNQVMTYEFRTIVRNFKTTPVALQVWDRLPKPDDDSVAVSLVEAKPELSADPLYQRIFRPDNLLRWDLTVPPGTIGEKALPITYRFRVEHAKQVALDYLHSGGLMENPIGGMGGMGGGMGGMGGGFRSIHPR